MLRKSSKLYAEIIFIIWQVISYYANCFCYSAPASMFDMNTRLYTLEGLQFIDIRVPLIRHFPTKKFNEIREVFQQYLTYALLPESSLRPYAGGNTAYDIVEPIFVDWAMIDLENNNNLMFRFLYICDPISFDYYKTHQIVPKV